MCKQLSCRDCWCVAIGNSYDNEERCVLAGYDNGDVKMFDLRMNKVCSVQTALMCEIKHCTKQAAAAAALS
jgi:hypothetical protein